MDVDVDDDGQLRFDEFARLALGMRPLLDALQARAPGAVVQVVLSHCDRLPPIATKLESKLGGGAEAGEALEESGSPQPARTPRPPRR